MDTPTKGLDAVLKHLIMSSKVKSCAQRSFLDDSATFDVRLVCFQQGG